MKNLSDHPFASIPITVGRFPFGATQSPRMLLALGDEGRPSSMRQFSCPIGDEGSELADSMRQGKEEIVLHAISAAINLPVWSINGIAGRLRRCYDDKTHVDMWLLDGVPILEIWPFELTPKTEDGKLMIVGSFGYYIYPIAGGAN